LEQTTTLKTVVSQIKNLQRGDTVGYNASGRIDKPTTIATVAIGYADGYSRSLGNRKGSMFINGKKAATIGDVCMDMCMLDVTSLDCKEGDDVVVFGAELPIVEFSKMMQVIPYEALTRISQRVKRVYFKE